MKESDMRAGILYKMFTKNYETCEETEGCAICTEERKEPIKKCPKKPRFGM